MICYEDEIGIFYVNGEFSSLTTRYVDVKAWVYKRMFHILEVIGTDKVQA